ncbi:hypothetical protein HKX48_002077 [Thoreauomyces humboldtii]|nr:hypothetical protein HKX48_002077 [Thoreauomyces humboldtii]
MHFPFNNNNNSSNQSPSQGSSGGNYAQWRASYLRATGEAYYVDYNQKGEADVKNALTVSEAHGYGMLLAVYHNAQADFDGYIRYFDLFRNPKGLMGWQQVLDHSKRIVPAPEGGTNSATDGDIDIAHALFLAAEKWPREGQDGRPATYLARAQALCDAILRHTVNPELQCLTLGDWVNRDERKFWNMTRPSDFILLALSTFAQRDDPQRRDAWARLISSTISIALTLSSANPTGLLPDFATFHHGRWEAVHGEVLESEHDGHFHYNACRCPWRIAAYWKYTGDARVLPILQNMARFFDGQKEVQAGYKLNGKSYADYTEKCFTAPAWLCLHVLGSPNARRVWDTLKDDEASYFGDSIEALCIAQS